MNAALEAGCDDFQTQEDVYEIYTDPADFSSVREEMEKAGYAFLSAEIQMVPKDTVDLTTDDKAELVEKFGKMLDRSHYHRRALCAHLLDDGIRPSA